MLTIILVIGIVLLDQASKILAVTYLKDSAAVNFIPGIFSFRYHENKGAAWGMLADQRWIFMVISTIAILGILGYFIYTKKFIKEKRPTLETISLIFFCGGGIGNMIDRVILGYVVDFLRFDFIDFPIFNVADSFISIGAVLMVINLIIETVNDYKKSKS